MHRETIQLFKPWYDDREIEAIASYAGAGFREEGCLRQHVFAQGRYQDVVLMAKIRQDTTSPGGREPCEETRG